MKRIFTTLLLVAGMALSAFAQADKIVGQYDAVYDGVHSVIKFFKMQDGRYRGQVTWVSNLIKKDGTVLTDYKNPDKSKRSVRADQIVVVEGVTYNPEKKVWAGSKIYDPTSGNSYKVELSFKDDNTLTIKGSLFGISKKVYWTRKKD